MSFDVPVAFLVFNRPELTRRVLAEIAKVEPRRLLVVADGPRASHPEDAAKCAATRKLFENLDWKCELLTNLSEVNLGCKRRISSGLDWVFQQCEEAIILEDDCVPDPTFFPFCSQMLSRYRDDERVCMITGTNLLGTWKKTRHSYFFSRSYSIWGWATWRRAWRHYDVNMKDWPEVRQNGLLNDSDTSPEVREKARRSFDAVHGGEVDTWDIQWGYACAKVRGLEIVPRSNLITNIGFGAEATHTRKVGGAFANLTSHKMRFPLVHPETIKRSIEYERDYEMPRKTVFRSVRRSVRRFLKRLRLKAVG